MTYPRTDFDNAKKLLSLLGSFWLNTYQGVALVESGVASRAQLDAQTHLDLLGLVASMSRFDVPVFHQDDWHFLTLRQSQRNQTPYDQIRHDGSFPYQDGGPSHGDYLPSHYHAWPAPAGLAQTRLILNRITDASLTLTAGVDYFLSPDRTALVFRDNPFDSPLVAKRPIFQGDIVVDYECGLWLYRGGFDFHTVYHQFGYVLDYHTAGSSDAYKQLVNAVYDALVEGTTARSVQDFFAAVAGVSLAKDHEEVGFVFLDNRGQWVVTDKNAYPFAMDAAIVVTVGDVLEPGDPLCDAVSFHDLNRGVTPQWLLAVSLDINILSEGYFQGVIFENQEVPLVVEEVDGRTRVSFAIQGYPGDVDKFWDDIHTAGLARGQTLAQLMDTRPPPQQDDPTAAALPVMINPLHFLVENVLRNNVFVVRLRTGSFGPDALGLAACRLLRMIIPPQTLCVVMVELFHADLPVILDGPGDQTRPGYAERAQTLPVMAGGEVIGPGVVTERVRTHQVAGRCT